MNHKHLFLIASFLLLLLSVPMVSACTENSAGENEATSVLPDLDMNDFEDVVSAKAIIVPHRDADLSFKTSGRVEEILVEEGEAVTAGQDLARIDTRDLELAVMKAQAGFLSAQANLEKLKTGARPQEIAGVKAAADMSRARAVAAQSAVNIAKGNLAAIQAEREALESAVLRS